MFIQTFSLCERPWPRSRQPELLSWRRGSRLRGQEGSARRHPPPGPADAKHATGWGVGGVKEPGHCPVPHAGHPDGAPQGLSALARAPHPLPCLSWTQTPSRQGSALQGTLPWDSIWHWLLYKVPGYGQVSWSTCPHLLGEKLLKISSMLNALKLNTFLL